MNIAEQVTQLKTDFDEVKAAGIADGKQAERDAFWDAFQYQSPFPRGMYPYAFFRWEDAMYNPKYPIRINTPIDVINITPTGPLYTYAESNIKNTKVPIIITSACSHLFAYSAVETIPELAFTITTYSNNYGGIFYGATLLKNVTYITPIYVALSYQWCPYITVETLRHTMDMLYDYAGAGMTGTYTLTIGGANLTKLTDEDLLIARKKGWTVV